ncbi:MAG: iron-sulfur cluster assembly protein [Gemmataceae bacterium]|nr:iron-sulfur cluster assembly protein [Gemmataceae bacterium]
MEKKRVALPVMGQLPEVVPSPMPEPPPDATLEERVVAVLQSIHDPEIPVNIHELGLIYKLDVSPAGEVGIDMTLTSPNCPVAGSLVGEVQRKVAALPGVAKADVRLVWEPPWDKSRMSEAAMMFLGLD